MTTNTLVSNSGAPIIDLLTWVTNKNDPALTALHEEHVRNFLEGRTHVPMTNPAMDNMFNQFLSETNQKLVAE